MSKIIQNYNDISIKPVSHSGTDAYTYRNGESDASDFSDGDCWSNGESSGLTHSCFLRISGLIQLVDPINLEPLTFFVRGFSKTWDEVWEMANQDEKLILIQLMCLK